MKKRSTVVPGKRLTWDVNIFEPLPRKMYENRYLVVMIGRYSKLTREMPTAKTWSSHVANVLLFSSWVLVNGIPGYIQTKNEVQFTSKLFATIFIVLGMKLLTATAFHSQTNKWVGQTIQLDHIPAPKAMCGQKRKVWDTYVL